MNESSVIGNIAYAITAASLLVRDILWLRVLSALANGGFICGNLVAPGAHAYAFVAWSSLFLGINLVQISRLIVERRNIGMSAEDKDLHAAVFPNLPVGDFRVLLKAGERRKLREGAAIVAQGDDPRAVFLVEQGAIRLERDGKPVARLVNGQMLGEIAFVRGRPYSSGARAEAPTRVVVWERSTLDRLFVRRPSIALGFHAAFIGRLEIGAGGLFEQPVTQPSETSS